MKKDNYASVGKDMSWDEKANRIREYEKRKRKSLILGVLFLLTTLLSTGLAIITKKPAVMTGVCMQSVAAFMQFYIYKVCTKRIESF